MVYETEKGDLIEANLPNANKSIKNKIKNEEVTDMIKKKDMTEDVDAGNMEAKYVKLGENYDQPDPEVVEADRKHIDMNDKEKAKKEEEGAEAGEMEAETPEAKKSKKDKKDDFSSFKEDMIARFEALEKENAKLKGDITEINSKKIAEKETYQENLISDMSDKYMVPTAWLKEKAKKYNEEDFIQDMYEGLSFAFGTIPGAEVEAYKTEDMATGLLSKVDGLEMM